MRRAVSALVTVALVLCTVAAPVAAGLDQPGMAPGLEQQTATGDVSEENESDPAGNGSVIAPGELLVGVVGVQEAEIEGEIESRAFGIRVARVATANAKADVVKSQLDAIEGGLAELNERKRSLDEARENGTISEGRYRAEIATVATRTQTVKRLANDSEDEADALPRELLESKGINVTAIQTLKQNASELTGPEVAEIARSIAGPGIAPGRRLGAGVAGGDLVNRTGPPGFVGDGPPADASNRGPGGEAGPGSESDDSPGANSGEGNETREGGA